LRRVPVARHLMADSVDRIVENRASAIRAVGASTATPGRTRLPRGANRRVAVTVRPPIRPVASGRAGAEMSIARPLGSSDGVEGFGPGVVRLILEPGPPPETPKPSRG